MTSLTSWVRFGRKILAIGRNFRDHAKELNNPIPTEPVVFMKPTSAYLEEGKPIRIPLGCKEMHHEVELGVIIDKPGSHISRDVAMEHVGGYALALDMSARDFQDKAKKSGLPWTIAKGFDTSCPVSRFISPAEIGNPHNIDLWLKINGNLKQSGNTSDMIFDIPSLISYISQFISLETGDLILTGTPAGVGKVLPGDVIECGMGEHVKMSFNVQ